MIKFSINVVITSALIFTLGVFLGGCCRNKDESIFSKLNGHSINIKPNNQQSMSRWISTNIKTEPNIHNQLSYLESCISKRFHINLPEDHHLPLQLQNGVQYLDPEKDKNEIKLLSDSGETGSFNVTWAYTTDQKQIFQLYRKLQSLSVESTEMDIDGKITSFDDPFHPDPIHLQKYINQVRNAISKALPEIKYDEKSMINFSETSDLKLYFGRVRDIFPELCLSKNQAKYSFKNDGVLGKDTIKPAIKIRWYGWPLAGFSLKIPITDWLNNWFDYFDFYIKEHKYADEDSCFISDVVCYQLGQNIPELTPDLYDYFTLSHTELFVGQKVPVQLYFQNLKWKISFEWTIIVKGYDKI